MLSVTLHTNLLLFLLSSIVATPLTDEQIERYECFLQTLIKCRDNLGITMSLVRNGETVYANGFGLRDRESGEKMEVDTLINVASLTKAFTATLAADVIGKGLATWDTPLQDILGPEFRMEGDFRTAQVCLRDLLAHKVGVPRYWGVSTAAMNVTRQQLCMNRFRYFPMKYDFRSRHYYANYPYVLAGYVTEVLSGIPWEQHLRQTLFEQLGMQYTKVSGELTDADWTNTAYSYINTDGEYKVNPERDQLIFLTGLEPAAGIFSNAIDMGKWMQFHLRGGKTADGRQLVPLSALSPTYKPQSPVEMENPKMRKPTFPVDDTRLSYGLGWNAGTYRGYGKLYHESGYSAYSCRLTLIPEMDIGAWACVNSPGNGRAYRSLHVATAFGLDLLLDKEPWLNQVTACTFPAPWNSTIDTSEDFWDTSNPELLARVRSYTEPAKSHIKHYVGEYGHKAFGVLSIFLVSENQLRFTLGRLLQGEVNPSGKEDLFLMKLGYPISYTMAFILNFPDGLPLMFSWNADRTEVVSVEVTYLEFDLPPVFMKGVVPDS